MEHGPYRKGADTRKSIEELRELIATEDKIGVQLPEDVKDEYIIQELGAMKKMKTLNQFKDVVLYSSKLGVLRFSHYTEHFKKNISDILRGEMPVFLYWLDERKNTELTVQYNPSKKEFSVFSILKPPPKKLEK